MKLLSGVLVTKPDSCYNCEFHSTCADNGEQCCGSALAMYERPGYKGASYMVREYISCPEDALKYGKFCMFVDKRD